MCFSGKVPSDMRFSKTQVIQSSSWKFMEPQSSHDVVKEKACRFGNSLNQSEVSWRPSFVSRERCRDVELGVNLAIAPKLGE